MSVTALVAASVSGSQVNALDLGSAAFPFSESYSQRFTSGTGAAQVDKVFTDQRTLAASATEDLDLAGALTDGLGASLTFAKVKCVMIKAAAGNTNDVVVSRPASNGFVLFAAASDAISVKPGGVFLWACPGTGITVTAGTGDLLTITNSAGTTGVTYDVVIMGTSA